jgi:hypothetical protein
MEKHIIKLSWASGTPCLEYRFPNDRSKNLSRLDLSRTPLSFKVLDKRVCIGSISLLDLSISPCRHQKNLSGQKQKQCFVCSQKTGFQTCISCKGQSCESTSQDAISYCSHDHYVYLAYYPGDLVKVGTTAAVRKEQRLLEQGAEFAILVAKADGMDVRAIEKACSSLGYTQMVRKDYKFKTLLEKPDSDRAFTVLIQALEDIRLRLDLALLNFFQEPELLNFSKNFNTALIEKLPKRVDISPGLDIFGDYVTVKGDVLVFRQSQNLFAISLDLLLGHHIADIDGEAELIEIKPEEQLSFF